MRLRPALLALALTACDARQPAVPHGSARPLRVMSMNQCTDQLVLALLPPKRIASVSWLSRDSSDSLMAGQARAVGVNHGYAEEVIDQQPDLVIVGSFTTPVLRGMLHRLGYPLVEVEQANSLDDVRRVTRQVAAAVGESARGEALLADMDRKLAALARDPGPPIRVVAWDRTGFAAGEGTLYDAVLSAAGARNLARDPLLPRHPDVETLLQANPAFLVQGSMDGNGASLGDNVRRHRLVRRYWADRTLFVPQAYYACGTPMVADAAIALRRQLRGPVDRAGPAVPRAGRLR